MDLPIIIIHGSNWNMTLWNGDGIMEETEKGK